MLSNPWEPLMQRDTKPLKIFCLLALFTLSTLGNLGFTQEDNSWTELFDGQTLEGWTQRGGQAKYSVRDGVIVGETVPNTPNSFLCTKKMYSDFQLELEFKVHPELNSGIQFRSNSMPEYKKGRVHGYQCEIDPSDRCWSAGIYDEARRGWLAEMGDNRNGRYAFRHGAWNKLRIEAIGNRLRTWINDVPASDIEDSKTQSGFIALQVHGVGGRKDPLDVMWREIRIRETSERWPEPKTSTDQPPASVFQEGAEIRKLADGFRFTEGPAINGEGLVYFNDIPNQRTHVYSPSSGNTTVVRNESGKANGMYFSPSGALIVCEGGTRKLTRIFNGKRSVLAETYEGKQLNSPNDLVLDPQGGIYFSDPRYGNRDDLEQPVEGVYYLPRNGKLKRVIDDLSRPNGLILSPDHRKLYVADQAENTTWVYDVQKNGDLKNKTKFCDSGSDGMTVDQFGNLFLTSRGEVIAFAPDGQVIGRLKPPEAPSNCVLVGNKLYITARTGFYVVETNTKGLAH